MRKNTNQETTVWPWPRKISPRIKNAGWSRWSNIPAYESFSTVQRCWSVPVGPYSDTGIDEIVTMHDQIQYVHRFSGSAERACEMIRASLPVVEFNRQS